MHLRPGLLPLLLAGSLLSADTLTDLKGTLSRLNGQEPVKATVDYQFWNRQGDDKKPVISEGRASSWVEDGPQGLRLSWSRSLIQAASEEARAQNLDPEKKTPTRSAIEGLRAIKVSDYLNGAGELLRTLEQGQLLEEKPETWQGKPVRLLKLKLTPRFSQRDQKYIKESEASAKVWVGADGIPLAAESQFHLRGRAFLVISFEQQEKEEFRFARVGNRLVVVHHQRESSGSGGGEKGQSRNVMNLSLN